MVMTKTHLMNLMIIFTRIKLECIIKHIHKDHQKKEKVKILIEQFN